VEHRHRSRKKGRLMPMSTLADAGDAVVSARAPNTRETIPCFMMDP
jgi:hypothetical protein